VNATPCATVCPAAVPESSGRISLAGSPALGAPVLAGPPAAIGRVHSVETAGLLDGPGIRQVIFLSGCPLRCRYCHNPDTVDLSGGKPCRAEDLLADLARRRAFLRKGGLTLSGGEPLVQTAFTKALLRGAKALGLHTAVDTSGYLGARVDDELIELTDLWLLDIKSFDPATYKKVTGVEVAPTLAFARRLAERKRTLWIRFVLVPGLTDDEANIDGVAGFVASLGAAVERVEVLPFHKMGEAKWAACGVTYTLGKTPPPTPEATEAVRTRFRSYGLKVF